jgi:hypothetical protein
LNFLVRNGLAYPKSSVNGDKARAHTQKISTTLISI